MESEIIRNIYAFRQHLICSEKAQATIEKYLRDLKTFLIWKGERELNKELTLQYKSYLMKSYQPASVNSILSSLNSFFTFSIDFFNVLRYYMKCKEKNGGDNNDN